MDFFEAQARAKKRTTRLIVLFVLAIAATIAVTYLATSLVLSQTLASDPTYPGDPYEPTSLRPSWDPQLFAIVAGGLLLVIGGASFFRAASLRRGGPAVAEMVGGRRVEPQTTDLKEKRLLNIVEEMAIASGVPVPAVYVLDDEAGLNAFAAGLTTTDAVVAVTRGTLDKLNRDELQGVVAHEFSHILNGDMRLNIRLVAVLFGIFFLTIVGRGLLRVLFYSRGRSSKRDGDGRAALVFAALGLVLVVIGYIGYLFGRMIQAAVSRQREFLADASAVQFTRNPGGIGGALKKIGGYALGGRVASQKAAAIGHFFFAEGLASNFFGLLATHPPLDERIRAIEPQFDGKYFEPPEVVDVERESFVSAGLAPKPSASAKLPVSAPDAVIASIGMLTAEQVGNAQLLLQELPTRLRDAAHSPTDAPALLYGLLLDADPAVRERQLTLLPDGAAARVQKLDADLRTLRPEQKIPLSQLAMPALREISDDDCSTVMATTALIAKADGRVSTFEFALEKLLHHQLVLSHSPAKPGAQVFSWNAFRGEIATVLSALAYTAASDIDSVRRSFDSGARLLKMIDGPFELLPPETGTPERLGAALDRLAHAAGPIKQRFLLACAHAASSDGTLHVAEAELLRAIAATLDCPMPPLQSANATA